MKKLAKTLLIMMLVAVLLTAFAGCNLIKDLLGKGSKDNKESKVFALSVEDVAIQIGNTYEVVLSSDSTEEDFTLTSNDTTEEYITITGHKIKGNKLTTSDIVVTATAESGATDTLNVRVTYQDVKGVTIKITNEVDQTQLLSSGETPQEVEFGYEISNKDNVKPLSNADVTWTLYNSSDYKLDTKKSLTYSYTPSKDSDYKLTVKIQDQTASFTFGAHGAIYIADKFNKESYEVGENIKIRVVFITDLEDGDDATLDITLDGVKTSNSFQIEKADGRAYVDIDIPAYDSIGTHSLVVSYDGNDSNTMSLKVEKYVTAERISISSSGALLQTGTNQNVSFVANVTPNNTDKSVIEWYVNGVKQSTTGTIFNYTPTSSKNAEYHIEARLHNLKSSIETIVYLKSTSEQEYAYAQDEAHKYGGYSQNRYITNAEELKNITLYAIENQLYGDDHDMLNLYLGYDYQSGTILKAGDDDTYLNRFSVALETVRDLSEESGILPGFGLKSTSEQKISIYFIYDVYGYALVNAPTEDAPDTQTNVAQATVSQPHYTEGVDHDLYIDSCTGTMLVKTSNMLYKAVQWGYQPTFESNLKGQQLQQIYNNARATVKAIIRPDMTEFEKVHAIYDWIIYNVRYDFDCSKAPQTSTNSNIDLNNKMKYYGYYLEGIFLNQFYNNNDMHAVCDGRSKAFVLLCSIEGITSVRIAGVAGQTESKGGHAWNKVLLDVGEDSVKEWLFVDTTWGDSTFNGEEYLSHAYFLIKDSDTSTTHIEYTGHNYPLADGKYDYFAEKVETVGDFEQSYKITGLTSLVALPQLTRILKAERAKGNKYIEYESTYAFSESEVRTALGNAGYSSFISFYPPQESRSGAYYIILA